MMGCKKLEFVVYGKPVGKQRHRTTKSGHIYTPPATVNYERLVRDKFISEFPAWEPHLGPVMLSVRAYYPFPKSWPKKKKAAIQKMLMQCGCIPKMTTPDLSNIEKSVEDALNKVAYKDDNQIFRHCNPLKGYGEIDGPRIDVALWFYDIE